MQTKIKVFLSRQENHELIARAINHVIDYGGSFSLEHTLENGNAVATYLINWPEMPQPVESEASKAPEVVAELERKISQLEMEKEDLEHELAGYKRDAEMFRYVKHPSSDVGFSAWDPGSGEWRYAPAAVAIAKIERGILENENAE